MQYKRSGVEYRCHACAKVLVGYDGAIYKNENYISLKGGFLNLQLHDKETDTRYYCRITDPEKEPLLIFCDLKCLQRIIDFRYAEFLTKRDKYLRSQAEKDFKPRNY